MGFTVKPTGLVFTVLRPNASLSECRSFRSTNGGHSPKLLSHSRQNQERIAYEWRQVAAWWGATCRRRRRQEGSAPSIRGMAIDGAPRGRTKALQSRVEKPLLKNPLELVKE